MIAARADYWGYLYAANTPLSFNDPSGMACQRGKPPEKMLPDEDTFFPVPYWMTPDGRGTRLQFRKAGNQVRFQGIECDCCTMDIEVVANAFRFFRWLCTYNPKSRKNDDCHYVDHSGQPNGLGFDPRDFFSVVVVAVCKSNIICDGVPQKDTREVIISRVFQKGDFGVFIRDVGGIEVASEKFDWKDEAGCSFAADYLDHLWRNTEPGKIEGGVR